MHYAFFSIFAVTEKDKKSQIIKKTNTLTFYYDKGYESVLFLIV